MSERGVENRLISYLSAEVQRVEPPAWWDNVIPRLGERVPPASFGERLKGVFSSHVWRVAVPVGVLAALFAALMVWQPWGNGSDTQGVIARAQAAIKAVQSYRVALTATSADVGQAALTTLEVQFAAPDRYQVKGDIGQNSLEFVLIGDSLYFGDGLSSSLDVKTITRSYSSMVTREAAVRQLDNLKNIVTLPDETVGDTLCLHYRGEYDYEKQLRSAPRGGLPPLSEGEISEQARQWESTVGSVTIELWIGKDDNLVRRMISQTTKPDNGGVVVSSSTDFRFSDFNGEIVVDAPLDKSGQLLPGWTSTVPESPGFAADIRVEVDNYDPSSRKIDYAINLVNIGKESLTEVEVRIVAVFPGDPPPGPGAVWYQENSGQDTRGPYIVAPGDSLKYTSTFGYDATSTSPHIVAAKIERSYVEVSYTGLDGQPKVETFHLEVPPSIYKLSTSVPPGFIAVQLEAVGEYTITEKGAISAHNYVQGEIGGQKYLFVGIRTQSMEKPGILVLDIQNPARPTKTGYISAEDAKYISSATLSGTVLYVQTDSFLWVIDVANPSMPRELARLTELRTESMVVSGDIAYINDGNHDIVTLDISDPANPVTIGRLPLPSTTRFQLTLSGDWLFTSANDVVYCIDATSPASLKIVSEGNFDSTLDALDGTAPGIISPYHTQDFFVTGHRMYVILTGEAGSGIVSLDISDPANPRQAAFLKLKNIAPSGPSFVSGERLYFLAVGGYGPLDHRMRLAIIDISQADKLSEMGYGILPEPWRFFDKYNNEGSSGSFSVVEGYLYWFIGNEPNQPVIEIFELPGK